MLENHRSPFSQKINNQVLDIAERNALRGNYEAVRIFLHMIKATPQTIRRYLLMGKDRPKPQP